MINHKIIAASFIILALVLSTIFYVNIFFPESLEGYFKKEFYNQFGPLAISIELFIAGYYLLIKHQKANFTLALFGFTALFDPLFNLTGIFTTLVPIYATILFVSCALVSLWLAFTNAFDLGKISLLGAIGSCLLGISIELFFNYLLSPI